MATISEHDELTEEVERLKLAVKVIDGKRKWFEDGVEYDDDDDNEEDRTKKVTLLTIEPHNSETYLSDSNIFKEKNDFNEFVNDMDDNREQIPAQRCLQLNLRYQEWIKKNLNKVMLMLNHNRDCQEKLQAKEEEDMKNEKLQEIYKKKINSFRPYFKDSEGSFPNPNRDTIDRANQGIVDAYTKQEKLWSNSEKEILKSAVRREVLAFRTSHLSQKIDIENAKLDNVKSNSSEEKIILKTIKKLKNEIESFKDSDDDNVAYGDISEIDSIDWVKISNKDMRGDRSAENCRLFWKNAAHPLINNSRWTREEEVQLLNIVQKTGAHDWVNIADLLGTRRSAFMCIQRYQTKLNPCLHTGKWLKVEDQLLDEFASMYRKNNYIPWTIVSKYIDGRSEEQCIKRWKQLHPQTYVRGKWTAEEDEKLKKAVEMFGTNWLMVHKYVPGRNSYQCRERYLNTLHKNIKFGNWSYEEDRTLWITVKTIGEGHWSYLSKILHHRTDNMLLQRYRRLCHKASKSNPDTYNYAEQPVSLAELKNVNNLTEEELIKNDWERGIRVPRTFSKHGKKNGDSKENIQQKENYQQKENMQQRQNIDFKEKLDYILLVLDKKRKMKLSQEFINQLYEFKNILDLTNFLENILNQLSVDNDFIESGNNDSCDLEPNTILKQADEEHNIHDDNLFSDADITEEKKLNKSQFLDWEIMMELNRANYENIKREGFTHIEEDLNEEEKKILQMISGALKINYQSANRPEPTPVKLSIASSSQTVRKTKSTIVYDNIEKVITQKLIGRKAIGAYSILPLPPNTSSVLALKSIYDNRHMLTASAGEFGILCDKILFKDPEDDINLKPSFTKYENTGVNEYLEDMHDYQILRSRFISLFLWPSLLASLPVQQTISIEDENFHTSQLNRCDSTTLNSQKDESNLLNVPSSILGHINIKRKIIVDDIVESDRNPNVSISTKNGLEHCDSKNMADDDEHKSSDFDQNLKQINDSSIDQHLNGNNESTKEAKMVIQRILGINDKLNLFSASQSAALNNHNSTNSDISKANCAETDLEELEKYSNTEFLLQNEDIALESILSCISSDFNREDIVCDKSLQSCVGLVVDNLHKTSQNLLNRGSGNNINNQYTSIDNKVWQQTVSNIDQSIYDSIIDTNNSENLIGSDGNVSVRLCEKKFPHIDGTISCEVDVMTSKLPNNLSNNQLISDSVDKCNNMLQNGNKANNEFGTKHDITNVSSLINKDDEIVENTTQNTDKGFSIHCDIENKELVKIIRIILENIKKVENNEMVDAEINNILKIDQFKRRKRNTSDSSYNVDCNFKRKSHRLQCIKTKSVHSVNTSLDHTDNDIIYNLEDDIDDENDDDYTIDDDDDDYDDDDNAHYSLNVAPKKKKVPTATLR